jgi:hypothetical protein
MLQVCEMLSGMSDPEEAQLLRSNVLDEISSKLLPLATDAASSTLLEQVRHQSVLLALSLSRLLSRFLAHGLI